MPRPVLIRLGLLAYIQRAWKDGVRSPALAYTKRATITAWNPAAALPWYGPRLLAHEWCHYTDKKKNADHAPWYTFRVECAHAIRLRDPARILERSAPWRETA